VTFNPLHRQPIVEHIGAHILHDPSVNCSSKLCGLCLQLAPLCKIVLKKGKHQAGNLAIDMKASTCPNLVRFSIVVATVCSGSSPCTNHPFICPHCNDSEPHSVVWSYNFRFHLLHRHPRVLYHRWKVCARVREERVEIKPKWHTQDRECAGSEQGQCAQVVILAAVGRCSLMISRM